MSWAEQFNPNDKLANGISNSMANIKLDCDVSSAEMQAMLDSRKMGGCEQVGLENKADFAPKMQEQPKEDSFQPQMTPPIQNQGYQSYEMPAPVINQAGSSPAQYSYQPYSPASNEQNVQNYSYPKYSQMQYQQTPELGQYSSYSALDGYAKTQAYQPNDGVQYAENSNMTPSIEQG